MVGGNKHTRSIQTHTVDDNIHLPDGMYLSLIEHSWKCKIVNGMYFNTF